MGIIFSGDGKNPMSLQNYINHMDKFCAHVTELLTAQNKAIDQLQDEIVVLKERLFRLENR